MSRRDLVDLLMDTLEEMQLPPTWKATVAGTDAKSYDLCLDTPTRTVDTADPKKTFPSGICALNFPLRRTREQIAADVVAAFTITELHEALEWVRFDGMRIADPHPDPFEEEHWVWLTNRIGRVVKDYIKQFPLKTAPEE